MAFVAGFVIALAIGLAIGRFITVRLAGSRVVSLADQSRKLLEGAEQKIQSVRNERLRELEAEWTEKTRQFDKESSESRRDLKNIRLKLDKRHEKLSRMSHRMKDRESLLHSAADSLELLREELVREQRAAEELLTSSRQLEEDSASRHQALAAEEDRVRQLKDPYAPYQPEINAEVSGADLVKAQRMRRTLQERMRDFFATYDVIVAPNFLSVAPTIDSDLYRALPYADPLGAIGNACGLRAIALPCGFGRDHMPAGLQIVGPPWSEGLLLDLGELFQQRTEFHQQRPPLRSTAR